MAEMKKAPVIRFKGFSEEWVNSALGEVAEIKSGSTPLRSNPMFYENGNIPWVKTTDLNNSFITYTEEKITTHAKARVNPPNSVLVAMYGGFNQIGRTGLLALPAATNQALSVLNTNENEVLALYLLTWLNAKVDFWKMLAGSSRKDPNITGSDVSAFPISFPKAKEQTQIGSYFQHLDKLISLHQTKVNKLTNLKKAMLEKMFPKQGADVPEIRFKGFAGAWEEKRLGDVVECYSGGTPLVEQTEFYGGDIPFIRSAEINSNSTELYLTEKGLKNSSAKLVKTGDILYALYGATSGEVGRSRINGAINQAILAIIPSANYDAEFIMQLLRKLKLKIIGTFLQGGQGNLSGAIIKDLNILFPLLSEQQKIGAYFQNLDKTITLHQTELEKLKNLKKACLEKMFV